jgi:hypothetical protein
MFVSVFEWLFQLITIKLYNYAHHQKNVLGNLLMFKLGGDIINIKAFKHQFHMGKKLCANKFPHGHIEQLQIIFFPSI